MTMFFYSLCWYCIFQALVLLLLANGAPVLMNYFLGKRWASPIDHGIKLPDGQRLLGDTKTWRGISSAVCLSILGALFFGFNASVGIMFGLLSMLGDVLSSFIKRRCATVESGRERGLDTIPETMLPVVLLQDSLGLGLYEIVCIVGCFFLIEEYLSPILYRWHLRKRPY